MKKLLLLLFFVTTIALAGIPLSTNFTVNTALPIDDRMSVADTTARDAIPALKRWQGMLVYSVADGKHYTLIGGITNGDWSELSGGGGNLTEWVTATPYVVGNTVTETYKIYVCTTDHTSGTFATDYNTNGYWIELSAGVDLSGDQTISGNKTFSDVTLLGYPASEGTGVNVNGTTNESSLIISDVASTNEAQTILHRHSTTLEPLILSARSNSNADTEGDVVANQNMFSLLGTGWKTDNYKIFGSMNIAASTLGTLSSTSAPGKVLINTTPNGATVPTAHLTLDSDKSSVFEGSVTAKGDLSGHNFSKNNLLVNSNFEYSTVSTGWTITNATASASAAPVEGAYALSLSLTGALNVYQDSATNAARLNGLQGMASIKIKTSDVDGLKVCSRNDGTTSTSLCINLPKDGVWKEINIPFILSGTANGIAITSTGTSGTVEVDNAFVGTSAPFQNVNGAKLVGTLTYAAATNCQWLTSSNSFADFAADTDCATPTVTGSLVARATKIPGFTINNALPGTYRIVASGLISRQTNNGQCAYRYYDGTNSSPVGQVGANNVHLPNFEGHINLNTAQSTWNVSLQALSSTGTAGCYVELDTSVLSEELTFAVYYFPPESKIYSQASQDTDWQPCTFSTLAWQGLGTVTNNLICKRSMGDLLIKGSFTTGTVAASIAQIPLPTNFGTITTSSLLLSNTLVGITARGYASVPATSLIFGLIAQPSQTYLNVSNNGNTQYDIPVNGSSVFNSSEKEYVSELRVPINEWKNYGVIVGSFAGIEKCANDYECTDTFSATIDSSGNISNENIDWLSGTTCPTSGQGRLCTYQTFLKDGISGLSSPMNCVAIQGYDPTTANTGEQGLISSTTTGVNISNTVSGVGNNVSGFSIKCQKGTNDYKPKTAKVASSIGVPIVPGITTTGTGNLIDTFSASFAANSSLNSDCTTGSCYVAQIGSGLSAINFVSTGTYNLVANKTYSRLTCIPTFTSNTNQAFPQSINTCSNCNTLTIVAVQRAAGTVGNVFGSVMCQGSY